MKQRGFWRLGLDPEQSRTINRTLSECVPGETLSKVVPGQSSLSPSPFIQYTAKIIVLLSTCELRSMESPNPAPAEKGSRELWCNF